MGLLLVLAGVAVIAWVPAIGLSATPGPPTTTEPVTIGFTCTFNGITIADNATIQVTKPSKVEPGDEFNVSLAVTRGPTGGIDLPSATIIYTSRAKLSVTGGTAAEAWTPEAPIPPQNVKPGQPITQLPTMTAKVVAGPSGEVKVKLSNIYVIWRLYPFPGASFPLTTFTCICTPKQDLEVTIPIEGDGGTTSTSTSTTTTSTSTTSTSTSTSSTSTTSTTSTTTSTSSTTSTTLPDGPTSSTSPTSSTTSTTALAVAGSTTTLPASVLGSTTIVGDPPTGPVVSDADVAVEGASNTKSGLAFTGTGVGIPLSLGIGFLLVGTVLIVLDRRRAR